MLNPAACSHHVVTLYIWDLKITGAGLRVYVCPLRARFHMYFSLRHLW